MTSVKPIISRERRDELCRELSLVDIAYLALAKMAGPEGLSVSSASEMEVTGPAHQVVMRVLSKRKQAEMRRTDAEARERRRARRAAEKESQ